MKYGGNLKKIIIRNAGYFKSMLIVFLFAAMPAYGNLDGSNFLHLDQHQSQVISVKAQVADIKTCGSFDSSFKEIPCRQGEVTINEAIWLFFVALIAFVILTNKRRA